MQPKYATWQSRPVFVTSTFRDMQAERDYLRARVFPALEERLRRRYHFLEPIDLRWGVETVSTAGQQAKELLVLKVCLAEIQRSRPFLIGLVGDRYGWVPPAERMKAATDEAGYATDPRGKSVTALEIEYGILDSPGQQRRSRFYFRDPLPYGQMGAAAAACSDLHSGEPGAAEAHDRLEQLKARIRREMPGRWRSYAAEWNAAAGSVTGLEAWGEQVLADLWEDLDAATREFEQAQPATWQQEEAAILDQFVATQCRDFIGRGEFVADLLSFTLQDGAWGVAVAGEPGSGKSSLFGQLVKLLRERDDVLLLAHAAGISPRSGSVDSLLRRWTRELASSLGVADPVETAANHEEVEKHFASLLARAAATRRVVCLLDALNQFERTTEARYLTWLPEAWPAGARLVATAIPGDETAALGGRRGVRTLALPVLNEKEASAIAAAVCGRYHRRLNPAVESLLLAKRLPDGRPAAGNPLWLELAIEELNLLDADDFARADREFSGTPDERLLALMCAVAAEMPPDVASLYGWLLNRTEAQHGMAWARSFARLITLSRTGWRESDLEILLPRLTGEPWDPLRFAALRRSFRAHLVQRGGARQWDFSHAQLRAAVASRVRQDDPPDTVLHARMAAHLGELPVGDPLRETERMFHLIGAGDREGAAAMYAGVLTDGELAGATRALADHVLSGEGQVPSSHLAWVTGLAELPGLEPAQTSVLVERLLLKVGEVLEGEGRLALRFAFFDPLRQSLERLARQDPGDDLWPWYLSVSHERIGNVLSAQGNLAGALEAYRACLAIRERQAQQQYSGYAVWQRDLSVSQGKIGGLLGGICG